MINKLNKVLKGLFSPSEKEIVIKTNEIIDYINNNPPYSTGYLVYKALLTQSGANPPVEDDLDGNADNVPFVDTIEGVWSYVSTGVFRYTKAGAFPDSKKVNVVFGSNAANQSPVVTIRTYVIDANTIEINVGSLDGFTNPATFTEGDGLLYLQPITIEVYS